MAQKRIKDYLYLMFLSLIYLFYYIFLNKSNKAVLVSVLLFLLGIFLCNLFLDVINIKNSTDETDILSDRHALFPAAIVIMLYLVIGTYFSLSSNDNSLISNILIFMLTFISYFWKIKIKSFQFKVTFHWAVITLLLYLVTYIPRFVSQKYINLFGVDNFLLFLLWSICIVVFTAFREEFVFRGLLIAGLLGLGLDKKKVNIIQSIIFGLMHFTQYPELGYLCFIPTVAQMMMGFIMGKIYFKTNSLTPCIIYHALCDIIY